MITAMTTTMITAMTTTMITAMTTTMIMTITMVMRMNQVLRSSAPMSGGIWLPVINPMTSWLSRSPGCRTT